jgi:hypothetical protein
MTVLEAMTAGTVFGPWHFDEQPQADKKGAPHLKQPLLTT